MREKIFVLDFMFEIIYYFIMIMYDDIFNNEIKTKKYMDVDIQRQRAKPLCKMFLQRFLLGKNDIFFLFLHNFQMVSINRLTQILTKREKE